MNKTSFARGIGIGVIASLVGTIMMDSVIVVEYLIIGSIFGGGIPLGALIHVLLGSVLGVIFSVPVLTVDVLRIDTFRKGVVLGVLTGVVSISACVPFAILIREKITTILVFMTIPHLVWGIGLGVVAGYGMRPSAARDK